MKPFNLKEYLDNPDKKITTRYGNREVRIICTDRKNIRPVVALITDSSGKEFINEYTTAGWSDVEEKYPDKYDLFFADELTEFEEAVKSKLSNDYSTYDMKIIAKELLDIAKKELQPEIDEEINKAYRNQDNVVYKNGYDKGYKEAYDQAMKDFLEKAVDWLEDNIIGIIEDGSPYVQSTYDVSKSEFIEDLKKAMKKLKTKEIAKENNDDEQREIK